METFFLPRGQEKEENKCRSGFYFSTNLKEEQFSCQMSSAGKKSIFSDLIKYSTANRSSTIIYLLLSMPY